MRNRKPRHKPTGPHTGATEEPTEIAALRAEGGEAAIARLTELAAGNEAAVAKAARRALYTLGAPAPRGGPALVPAPEDEQLRREAVVTGFGFRLKASLLAVREERYGAAWSAAACMLSAQTGYVEGFADRTGRLRIQRMIEQFRSKARQGEVMQVPIDVARWIYADAIRRSSPQAVAQARADGVDAILGGGGLDDVDRRFAALEQEPDDALRQAIPRDPSDLCEIGPFATWFADDDATKPLFERVDAIVHSPLVLDDYQVKQRITAVVEDTADALFDAAMLADMRHAALVNALILESAGREAESRLARYHALAGRPDRSARDWPLAVHVVERTVAAYLAGESRDYDAEDDEEDEDEGLVETPSLIIRP